MCGAIRRKWAVVPCGQLFLRRLGLGVRLTLVPSLDALGLGGLPQAVDGVGVERTAPLSGDWVDDGVFCGQLCRSKQSGSQLRNRTLKRHSRLYMRVRTVSAGCIAAHWMSAPTYESTCPSIRITHHNNTRHTRRREVHPERVVADDAVLVEDVLRVVVRWELNGRALGVSVFRSSTSDRAWRGGRRRYSHKLSSK